jgi:hypothetical protein
VVVLELALLFLMSNGGSVLLICRGFNISC